MHDKINPNLIVIIRDLVESLLNIQCILKTYCTVGER